MKTEFKIRSGGPAEEEKGAGAWWLTGPDPARWLEVMVRMGIDRVPHVLHGIPEGDRVKGLLAIAAVDPGRMVPGATPCREVIPRVWIPAEAEATVAVRAADSESLPPGEQRLVLPSGRSVRLRETEAKTVGELLVARAAPAMAWNRAVVRDAFGLRLTAVIVPDLSTPEDLIKEAGEGIGKRDPKKLETLTDKLAGSGPGRAAGKVGEMAGVAALGALSGAAGALGKLGQALSGGAGEKQNWAERISQWASVNMAKLQERQDRTLDRLKDLLRRDPERGLEYALPLGDQSGDRGLGPPSASLMRRALDFDLSRLLGGGGGSAASPWQLSGTRWHELNQLYREAANREVRLGHYRRAAYIYAHLLSDYTHAAQVLRKGGYAREAAELYLKKLHHQTLAAECYVEAGMIDEAVAIYEERQELMKLAGLYEKLERFEDANATYWRVTELRLHRGDHVGASEIVDGHLHDPERAIAILAAAWPSGPDAPAALTREFALRARERDHQGARDRADRLRKEAHGCDAVTLASVLAASSGSYPERVTAEFLADATRLVSSKVLTSMNPPTLAVRETLEAVRRAGPADRFRHRDTVRYLESLTPARPFTPSPRTAKGQVLIYDHVKIVSERPVRFLKKVFAAVGTQVGYVLAGVDRRGQIIVDCERWHAPRSSLGWSNRDPLDGSGAWLSVYQRQGIGGRTTDVLLNGRFPPLALKQHGTEPVEGTFRARGGVDSQQGVLATCHDENGEDWQLVVAGGSLSLSYQSHHAPQSFLLHGLPPFLDAAYLEQQGLHPQLWVQDGIVIFSLGRFVGRFREGRTDFLELSGPVLELASKPRHTRPALAFRLLNGVWLTRPGEESFEVEPVAEGHVNTLCFTSEGSLVMMGRDIEVASVSSPAAIKESRRRLSFGCKLPGVPSVMFSTERRGEFAMVIRNQVYLCKLSEKRT